jgi:hypothetical protein
MKKTILTSVIAFSTIAVLVIGCSKNNTSSPSGTDEIALQSKVTQVTDDQTSIQNDDDSKANDAISATETAPGFGVNAIHKPGNIGTFGTPGDSATIDSTSFAWFIIDKSAFAQKIARIVLRYRGIADPSGYIKSGTITIDLINGKKWTDTGAILQETDSVTVTYNGKTRIYNCVRYVTNVSGGYYNVANLPSPFIYTMHAYGTVTFDNGSQRSYWITRRNTFTKTSPYAFTIAGDTTINSNVCTIGGVTRYGDNFLVQAPVAISSNQVCGYGNPTSGERIITYGTEPITVTFGVDATGTPITSGCAYGFKINWTKLSGATGTAVISY